MIKSRSHFIKPGALKSPVEVPRFCIALVFAFALVPATASTTTLSPGLPVSQFPSHPVSQHPSIPASQQDQLALRRSTQQLQYPVTQAKQGRPQEKDYSYFMNKTLNFKLFNFTQLDHGLRTNEQDDVHGDGMKK